ncbi:AMP/CMP kinase AK6 [Halarchaeum acidiphilum MH1-52-1]|uniref:Putative adenylate kinase n=1 Tax=Halarchaeum acidiphilum MH1-52-1 TaxID=1261545 RepID=U2YEX9_9EURY|nr:adenylate kinase family protein [Halarchaeum acidiphilum]GAD52451.1 AMP/CMP kinase AK6 [Halarchaeum acidiphilum MH1-52-1]
MRVVVTGTPGTGKTTATERLDTDLDVVHLNDVIREEGLYTERDEERDSLVADIDALVETYADADDVLVESHLAHHLDDADRVVVLRCAPETLAERLRERDESEAKARENAESEALDVILGEAVGKHGRERVYEVDTTDRTPDEVAAEIAAVIDGEREPSAGEVDFTEYLL